MLNAVPGRDGGPGGVSPADTDRGMGRGPPGGNGRPKELGGGVGSGAVAVEGADATPPGRAKGPGRSFARLGIVGVWAALTERLGSKEPFGGGGVAAAAVAPLGSFLFTHLFSSLSK